MESLILNNFQEDQDGISVDTACCYAPEIEIIASTLPAELGCDFYSFDNTDECFEALGPNKVAIIENIRDCGHDINDDVAACADTTLNSVFIARTNRYDTPDNATFWAPLYLRAAIIAAIGFDNFEVDGELFDWVHAWDGKVTLSECSTLYDPLITIPSAGARCWCHTDCLTSSSLQLRNGVACTPTGSHSCQFGLCVDTPNVDPECEYLGCDDDSDGACDDGARFQPIPDVACVTNQVENCDDNCRTQPNGPDLGTCITDPPALPIEPKVTCTANFECGLFGMCDLAQADTEAFVGDGVGDVCDSCPASSNEEQVDSDSDLVGDECDNCPGYRNEFQEDTDGDEIGDACDDEDDGDGLLDFVETNTGMYVSPTNTGTDPLNPDTDGDGFSDGVEVSVGTNPNNAGDVPADADSDRVPDAQDNCAAVPNAMQIDSNGDGCGNQCDPDLNNDGIVALPDYAALSALLGQTVPPADPDADLTGAVGLDPEFGSPPDGNVGLSDWALLNTFFGNPPGPGLPGDPNCNGVPGP